MRVEYHLKKGGRIRRKQKKKQKTKWNRKCGKISARLRSIFFFSFSSASSSCLFVNQISLHFDCTLNSFFSFPPSSYRSVQHLFRWRSLPLSPIFFLHLFFFFFFVVPLSRAETCFSCHCEIRFVSYPPRFFLSSLSRKSWTYVSKTLSVCACVCVD